MSTIGIATHRPVSFALSLGLLGGAALITTQWLTTRGPLILLPYAAIVIASAVYLRVEQVQPFSRRFFIALGSFMFASLLLYLFIGFVAAGTLSVIPVTGHAWRIGLLLLIGSLTSGAVAQLTATRPASAAGDAAV